MFQSEHVAARLHAAARAVGGCAIYTSDRPKVHDFALLRTELVAALARAAAGRGDPPRKPREKGARR